MIDCQRVIDLEGSVNNGIISGGSIRFEIISSG